MNDPKDQKHGFSRRAFLRGSGAVAATTSVTWSTAEDAVAAASDQPVGPGAVTVTLTVNGEQLETRIEPRVTLLDALRDWLDVTGCKRVCDRGTCGSCTVLLDGKPIYACSMLAIEAQGKKITTIEGLEEDGNLSRIQQAFLKHDASQCGFCTPGFVVACTAVLRNDPGAGIGEIERGLDGNICRCGTHEQMARAIADLMGGKS